jgi:hypothetical protein
MKNQTWNVTVLTESNYIKTVQVDNCITREDAEAAALGMTGARSVFNSTPVPIYQESYVGYPDQDNRQVVNNYQQIYENDYDDRFYEKLDKMEEEMYDIMCKLAIEEGRELPTIAEFYEYLNGNQTKPKGIFGKIKSWFNK